MNDLPKSKSIKRIFFLIVLLSCTLSFAGCGATITSEDETIEEYPSDASIIDFQDTDPFESVEEVSTDVEISTLVEASLQEDEPQNERVAKNIYHINQNMISQSEAKIMRDPYSDSEQLGVLAAKGVIEVTGITDNGWYRVDYGGREAYVRERLLSELETVATNHSATTLPSQTDANTSVDNQMTSSFSVTFIDVGQADAAIVECDGHYMLVDGGNSEDSSLIYSILKSNNISNLDIVVASHAHEDHVGGISGALNYATANLILCPELTYDTKAFESFIKYSNQSGKEVTIPKAGDEYSLGSAKILILGVLSADGINNESIVLRVDYGETSFLFTGDAEREAEQAILDSGKNLDATVLKVAHHGSDTSTTYPFLREVMPEYAVISVGRGNSYAHPTDNVLSKLRDAGAVILRTDLNGNIYFYSDGKKVSYRVDKEASPEEMLTPGYAVSSNQSDNSSSPNEANASSENKEAKASYILNTNTHKFHTLGCSSVDDMTEEHKEYFTGSREEAIEKGYSPCGRCNP